MRHTALALLPPLVAALACGGGPELRPGPGEQPRSVEEHGRIVSKTYRDADPTGPGVVSYEILEVDGEPIRVPGGYIEETRWPERDGANAVAAHVVGKKGEGVTGLWILQIVGNEVRFERLCNPGALDFGSWKGRRYVPKAERGDCGALVWDLSTGGPARR